AHLIETKQEEESIGDGTSTPTRRPSRKPSTSSNRPKSRKPSAISSSPNGGERASEEESELSDIEIRQVTTKPHGDSHSYLNQQLTVKKLSQEIVVNARHRTLSNNTDLGEVITQRGLPRENLISLDTLHNYILRLRKAREYSNTRTFVQCIVFFELSVFLYCAVEWNLKIATVPIPSFTKGTTNDQSSFDLHGPDIFVIIEWHRFWRPLIAFLIYLLAIPLGFSYMFNLDQQRHMFSPLAFSVAQCGIFLVTVGHFDWVEDVRDFIPENLIYVGSGAGIIFSLYESILTN
ncbi:6951_t:CDS:2, partial [Acaulospora morrowiae]